MMQDMEQAGSNPDVLDFTVTRLRQLATLSNIDIDQVFELAGVDLHKLNEDLIHQQAYWKLIRMHQAERERLQQFGTQLFANKLPDWLPE
jgi:hypothetical protein